MMTGHSSGIRRALLGAGLAMAMGVGTAQGAVLTFQFDTGFGVGTGSFDDTTLTDAGGGFWTSPILDFFFPYLGYDFTEADDPLGLAWLADPTPSFVGFEYNATSPGGNNVIFSAGADPGGSDWGNVEVVSGPNLNGPTPLDNTNTQQVPEPEFWLGSLLAGLVGLAARRRRRVEAEVDEMAAQRG